MIIECNCFLIDRKLRYLDIPQTHTPVKTMFSMHDIESIRESLDDDGEVDTKECMVCFKSGESMVVGVPYEKLQKLLCETQPEPEFISYITETE